MPLAVAGMAFLLTIPYVLVFILLEYRFCNCKNGKINQVKKILQIPVVVVSVELIRSLSVYGFPWNLVGYSIAHNDILLSIVSFGTIFLCSFLIVLIANLLTVKNNKIKIVAILVCLTWYGVGWFKVNTSKVQIMPYSLQTLQAETISHHHFDRIAMRKQFNQYLLMLKQAVKQGFQIIVMPEMAIPYPINTNPNLQKMLQSSLKEGQVLVVGAPAYENYDIYNAMYFISQDEVKRYDKKLLVPFGEFIPARTLFFFMKNFTNNFQDFSIGKVDNKFEFKGQSYLPLICYEAIFPFFVKTNMQKNSIIVNITNDAWFYGTIAPAQHALIAKTRAVENNAKMVRVANAGWSYIKDNYYGFNK
jgi:apolipoprotein N-acyltransferase